MCRFRQEKPVIERKMEGHMKKIILTAGLVLSAVATQAAAHSFPWYEDSKSFEERIEALINEMTLEEKVSLMLNTSAIVERLGIEEYNWWSEALHGIVRSARATVFPQAVGMGSTFDTNLLYCVGTAISDESRAINNDLVARGGKHIMYMGLSFWSPNVNIFRDPRWGRLPQADLIAR
jgi:beta-glucosidase